MSECSSLKLFFASAQGAALGKIETKTSVRTCNFSYSGNMALYSTDSQMGYPSEIFIVDVRTVDSSFSEADPILRIPLTNAPKATSMVWGSLDELVISGHDNGDLAQWDLRYVSFTWAFLKFLSRTFFSFSGRGRRATWSPSTGRRSTTCRSPRTEDSSSRPPRIARPNSLTPPLWSASRRTRRSGP